MNINPPQAPTDAPHPATAMAERLDSMFVVLLPVIAAGLHHLVRFCVPVWNRVSRARQRLARLLALLAAGRLPRQPRLYAVRQAGPSAPYIPHRRAWLVAVIGYKAAWGMAQMESLLRDPNTQALLATAPPQALKSLGRTLRPLCRLLGVDLPAELLLAPRARAGEAGGGLSLRRPKPAKPQRPPLLPLYPQRRPRPLPFMNFSKKNPTRLIHPATSILFRYRI